MKKEKKGISLIVLIITIIIMIVLAGTIILTLTNNDIIGNSRIAMFKNNAANYKADLNMSLSDKMLSDSTFNKYLVNAYTLSDIKEYIPSMKAGDEEKFAIQTGDLVYIGEDNDEILQMREIGIEEGFIIGRTYSTVYLNPNPMNPDDISIEGETWEDAPGWMVIMYGEEYNTTSFLSIKKSIISSLEENNDPFSPAHIFIENIPSLTGELMYWFGEKLENEENTMLDKGWNNLIDKFDDRAYVTSEQLKDVELSFGQLNEENYDYALLGTEFLHYYFSTVPY